MLSATWVLTAAHCLFFDDNGDAFPSRPSEVDVLTGTQNLNSGGTRVRASQFKVAPGFDWTTLEHDVALVRLAKPVRAPGQPTIGQGEAVPAGTDLVTTGWGESDLPPPNTYPPRLRQVHVPAVADGACESAYGGEMFIDSMFCAGDLADGGVDSCFGDSGGPILRLVDDRWVQVGIVSWGEDCALPGKPGVYSRLSKFANWVQRADAPRPAPHDHRRRPEPRPRLLRAGRRPRASSTRTRTSSRPSRRGSWPRTSRPARRGKGPRVTWPASTAPTSGAPATHRASRTGRGAVRAARRWRVVSSSFASSSEFESTYGDLDAVGVRRARVPEHARPGA